jgi:phosphoribosylformylglycinamidine synthase
MAAAAIDEAVRQIVAVGGSLEPIAILDNFCWGDPTRPEVLGSLTRAALGCYDAALAFGTPFISGKDSLHNAYRFGEKTIQIPGTLLISAIGVMADAARALSMDAKRSGNALYLVGLTKKELGGSSYYAVKGVSGGEVPRVDLKKAPALLGAVSRAIAQNLAVSAHDCSEGGLAVAAAEMAFAGELGLTIDLSLVPRAVEADRDEFILFSESPSRLLLEVPPEKETLLAEALKGFPAARIGQFESDKAFRVTGLDGKRVVETTAAALQQAWAAPFKDW